MHKPYDPHESEDRARLILALVVSLGIFLAYHFFVDKPRMEQARQKAAVEMQAAQANAKAAPDAGAVPPVEREMAVTATSARVDVLNNHLEGTLSLKGARLDDLSLLDHYATLKRDEHVALLSPAGAKYSYYVENGWLVAGVTTAALPGPDTPWTLARGSAARLEGGGPPVILQWNNGQGLTFTQEISLDEKYLFTVTQRVTNNSGSPVSLNPYQLTARQNMPKDFSGFFVLHEGPVYYLGGEGDEPNYKDLVKGEKIEKENVDGWLGFTDKYWLVALLPQPDEKVNARIVGTQRPQGPLFQADTVGARVDVAPGATAETTARFYAGVKDVHLMHDYEKRYGYKQLDLGIDFGMWYFITKPFYYLLHFLMTMTGSVAVAILLMTVIVRGAVFPLSSKSFRSMAKMRLVAPQLKELQTKYKDDKQKLQMEIFELYKRENVNPFSGCWPMMLQIPIFFALYKVILISVELRHAPFWGWIHDLSAPDPTSVFNLFGLLPFTPPQPLMIGAWPVLFCLSMVLQKRISPPMTDPMQEKLQAWFPYIVTVMLAHFAVGLVIYWTWSNILGTLQQYYILKKVGGEDTSLFRGHADRRKKGKKAGEEKAEA